MSKPSRSRKQLAANLWDQAKGLMAVVDKIPDVGDLSLLDKAVALLNSGFDRIPGILPSERPHMSLERGMIDLAFFCGQESRSFPQVLPER
jgi:hypothetical protein